MAYSVCVANKIKSNHVADFRYGKYLWWHSRIIWSRHGYFSLIKSHQNMNNCLTNLVRYYIQYSLLIVKERREFNNHHDKNYEGY